ncbi:hypothetical protein D3C80_2217560 [compost metagenome]
MVLGAWNTRADVGEHQVSPAVQGHQAVAGSQIDAQLPFLGAHAGLNIGRCGSIHGRFFLWLMGVY